MKQIIALVMLVLVAGCNVEDGKVTVKIGSSQKVEKVDSKNVVEAEKAVVDMVLGLYADKAFVPENIQKRLSIYRVDEAMKAEWLELSDTEKEVFAKTLAKVRARVHKNIENSMLPPELETKFKRLKPVEVK